MDECREDARVSKAEAMLVQEVEEEEILCKKCFMPVQLGGSPAGWAGRKLASFVGPLGAAFTSAQWLLPPHGQLEISHQAADAEPEPDIHTHTYTQ